MKHLRKLIATAVALVMALVIATPALAASDGTITVQNTVSGKTYEAYKVFDATYSGTNVTYTYDGSNATFLAALQAASSPFTVTANTAGTYNVAKKSSATAADISAFLTTNKANLGTAISLFTGDGTTQTKTGLDYGYYYITTTTGSIVTIDSALKDAVVIDKNEVINPPDKTEQAPTDTTDQTDTTANIGDVIDYKVTTTYVRYNGEELVTQLVFTDVMTTGLTPNQDVVVRAGATTLTAGTDYTVSYSGQTTTITIPTASATGPTFTYADGTVFTITYSGTLNENAVIAGENSNTVTLTYNNNQSFTGNTDKTTVETYKITLTKVNDDDEVLAGAKFKLYDAATGGNEIPVVLVSGTGTAASTVNNVYRHAKAGETGVQMVTGTTGVIEVQGLAAGSYYFEETEAPAGYNLLTTRTPATTITSANATIEVENQSGTELPSTGGMGTTVFYVVGGLMVVAAAVLLVAQRRVRA